MFSLPASELCCSVISGLKILSLCLPEMMNCVPWNCQPKQTLPSSCFLSDILFLIAVRQKVTNTMHFKLSNIPHQLNKHQASRQLLFVYIVYWTFIFLLLLCLSSSLAKYYPNGQHPLKQPRNLKTSPCIKLWWHTSIIPALQKLGQKELEFEIIPCLKQRERN